MDPKQHPTYQFLAAREALDPQKQTFLIVGNKPLLSQFKDGELQIFQLKVFDGEGKKAEWNTDKANVLEWRVDGCLANTSEKSLKWLEKRSESHEGGCFYITSALEVDLEAGGAGRRSGESSIPCCRSSATAKALWFVCKPTNPAAP